MSGEDNENIPQLKFGHRNIRDMSRTLWRDEGLD